MKKKFGILTIMVALSLTAQAQIYTMEDEMNPNRPANELNGQYGNIIYHGSEADQPNWVPLGSGILILAAFGGSYLIAKKENRKKLTK